MDKKLDSLSLVKLDKIVDSRGQLVIGEFKDLPFSPQRFFTQSVNQDRISRGGHAHKSCKQLLVPLLGEVIVNLFSGVDSRKVVLNDSTIGLYVPNLIWATQFFESKDTLLLVLASEPYLEEDYIRSFDEFKELFH